MPTHTHARTRADGTAAGATEAAADAHLFDTVADAVQ